MPKPRSTSALALLAALVLASAPVLAQDAGLVCGAGWTDKAERPTPAELVPRLAHAFGVPANSVRGASYVRCSNGQMMGCMVGANLNCSRANLSRNLPDADAFCRSNPGSDSVPMAATGHDTIYDWRCDGKHAVAGKVLAPVDKLGFMAGNWRPIH